MSIPFLLKKISAMQAIDNELIEDLLERAAASEYGFEDVAAGGVPAHVECAAAGNGGAGAQASTQQ